MSFKVEVIADASGKWVGNQLRFATKDEAEVYGADLGLRWTAVLQVRAVASETPVNYVYADGKLERVENTPMTVQ